MRPYASEANERWDGFAHRPGDIVISTRSKCGTTWLQAICALLVFGTDELPAPLPVISPWLDWDVEPVAAVHARLAAQDHRRIIKTHTPLDGIPLTEGVTYIVVGRHPLDVAVSLHHHGANIDRVRMAALSGRPSDPPPPMTEAERVRHWIADDVDPLVDLDTLPGLLHHLSDAWPRRDGRHDVVLVHHQDLLDDLEGQMRALAAHLGIDVAAATWPALVHAATFDAMRARAEHLAPDHVHRPHPPPSGPAPPPTFSRVLRDKPSFFRSGRPGQGAALLTDDEVAAYHRRAAALAPPDLLAWLHR